MDEALETPEVGWGTHELEMPKGGELIGKNLIAINKPAYKGLHRSYVPDEEFEGMDIPHGEAITISKFLTTEDYCPTVQFVYRLCP